MMMLRERSKAGCRGVLMTELVIAMAILTIAILPLSYGFWHEVKLARVYYQRALVMQLVDGEMEILAAGEWRAFAPGTHPYPVTADSVTNLPPGDFTLTVEPARIRLAWQPRGPGSRSPVVREMAIHEP